MGTGTDIAMEASDITLVKGNLKSVATALALSRATLRTIRQNLFWAFAYNVVLIPTAILSPLIPFLRERSEEHTSELQSQSNLVCRLLLEKKKTQRYETSI